MSFKFFKKPCKRCEEIFRPTSKENRICEKCLLPNTRRKPTPEILKEIAKIKKRWKK